MNIEEDLMAWANDPDSSANKEECKPRRFAYDEKCEELASYFLQERPDSSDAIKVLAQVIQDAIEDWLNYQLPATDCCEHDKTDLGHVHRGEPR